MNPNKIELIPLAVTGMFFKYARKLDDNKIVHYRVSAVDSILDMMGRSESTLKSDPFEQVRNHIMAEEPEAEVVLKDSLPKEVMEAETGIQVQDMSDLVLTGLPKIKSELLRMNPKFTILGYDEHVTPSDYPKKRIESIGAFGAWREVTTEMPILARISYWTNRLGLLKRVPEKYKERRIVKCTYLGYTYEEPDEAKAVEQMRTDLAKLSERGLILGHLAMPSSIYLADMVGSGTATKCLFCFIFVDTSKMYRQLNLPNQYTEFPLKLIGINEVREGGLGQHVSPKRYQIEEIEISERSYEKNRQAHIQSYLNSKDFVTSVAMAQKAALKEVDIKTSSVSRIEQSSIGPRYNTSVSVDIKVSKKEKH